ncbi:hypothetical protein [Paenibacillus sp. HB172176]|uniref:hypothetical protein n=1 Tax=Paenibacillus sp. HB172176 TaxID=2493690 RepID=UPI00197D3F27|nr:hypothetical protein [Paenibacillus sp. HB172176]
MIDMKRPQMLDERMLTAIRLHNEGVEGSEAAALEANRLLEQLRIDLPHSALLDAYYGSSMILIARDKINPFDKLRWSNNGLKLLDSAVAADPRNAEIRLLRGKNAYELPEKYFHRTNTVIEDYTLLIEMQLKQEQNLRADLFSQLLDELSEAYARIGMNKQAAALWSRLELQTQNGEWKQLLGQKRLLQANKPSAQNLPDNAENSTSMLIEGTRSLGNALLTWSGEKKKIEKSKKQMKEEKKQKKKLKEKEQKKEKKAIKKLSQAKSKKKMDAGKKIIRIKN